MVLVRCIFPTTWTHVDDVASFTGAAWHLDHLEIRRPLQDGKTHAYVFPCTRWFATNEDDRSLVRELIPEKVTEEQPLKRGQ
jgi:hypothetical protein